MEEVWREWQASDNLRVTSLGAGNVQTFLISPDNVSLGCGEEDQGGGEAGVEWILWGFARGEK